MRLVLPVGYLLGMLFAIYWSEQDALLLAAILMGVVVLWLFLMQGFSILDKASKERAVGQMVHVNIQFNMFERAMKSGEFRSEEELESEMARLQQQLQQFS